MKDKLKKYYKDNSEAIYYYLCGCFVGGVATVIVTRSNNKGNQIVSINPWWADESKKFIDVIIVQKNGTLSPWHLRLDEIRTIEELS